MTTTMERPATLPARPEDQKPLTFGDMLNRRRDLIASVVPKHMTPERVIKLASIVIGRVPKLGQATPLSLMNAIVKAAELGLDCSGSLGSAYLVPFDRSVKDKGTGQWSKVTEAQLIIGYRGLIDLARRSGQIDNLYAHVVYADDQFEYELGADPKLIHKPNLKGERKDDDIVGAYMVAFLKGSGRPHIEFMPRGDIEKIRKSSKAAFDFKGNPTGPWKDWFAEMCRKTVIRRGAKYLPMSVEFQEALSNEDHLHEERTEVLSASTGAGTAGVLAKLTSRPVSEGQTFEPSGEAMDLIDAEQQAPTSEPAETPAEEPKAETPEQEAARAQVTDALSQDWDAARRVLIDAGAKVTKPAAAAKGIDVWTKLHAPKANGDLLPFERRRELYDAIVEGRFDFGTGAIVAAG